MNNKTQFTRSRKKEETKRNVGKLPNVFFVCLFVFFAQKPLSPDPGKCGALSVAYEQQMYYSTQVNLAFLHLSEKECREPVWRCPVQITDNFYTHLHTHIATTSLI